MPEDIQVECYSGSYYGERPLAFLFEGKRHVIAAILQQWRMPEGICHRVITEEELRFDLIYAETEDVWSVIPLD